MDNIDVERGDVKNTVNETVQRLLNCVGENPNGTNKFPASIYKAPSTLRNLSTNSFEPRVVSIGPLHNKDENLQRFELQKAACVHNLIYDHSGSSATEMLIACEQKVSSKLEIIKECYADMKSYIDNDIDLKKMMVMDACFILEFIHKISSGSHLSLQDQYITYDLVLLENQIPFFVLESIYECIKFGVTRRVPITEFILPLMEQIKVFQGPKKVYGGSLPHTKPNHILEYLHSYYRPRDKITPQFPCSTIHSAIELDTAGVNFKPYNDPKWPMAMQVERNYSRKLFFWPKPTLLMPVLRIDDFTELIFRNLIAYEQSYGGASPHVTSYARAMNMLIDTDKDVAKLVRSKVIINHLGSNEEAAFMINRICKEVVPEYFNYTEQWKELDKQFKDYWPRWIMKLKRTYFHTPWNIIALFAGIVLFVLTLLQTIYTITSSYNKD